MYEEKESKLYPSLPQQINDLTMKQQNDPQTGKWGAHQMESHDDAYSEKKDYRYFWKRVLKDLTNKNLIPVKILFFFKYATLFVLYPFLTLHMDALGLNEWEIGVNQATAPVVAIFGPPIAGVLADKIGNFKVVLSFITLLNAAIALLLLLVPVARETVHLSPNITFDVGCDPSSHFVLNSVDPYDCALNSSRWSNIPNDNIIQCGQLCPTNTTSNDYIVFPTFPLGINTSFSITIKNQSYIFSTIFGSRPKFICNNDGVAEKCKLELSYDTVASLNEDIETTTLIYPYVMKEYSTFGFSKLMLISTNRNSSNETLPMTETQFGIQGPIIIDGNLHDNPMCTQPPGDDAENDEEVTQTCQTKCFLQMDRKIACGNDTVRKVYNVYLTFGLYTLFRLLLGVASSTGFIMFEGAVLSILKRFGGDYGLQRVSATFAAIIAAPLAGLLLQYYSFRPIFYLYAVLQVFSAIMTLQIDLRFKKPSENVLKNLKVVLSQLEIIIFFAAMLCAGTLWGYLETFLFLFLKKLGGTQTLMGLTISVGGLFGLPFLIFSRPIIKKIGHVNVLCIGLLFYGIRYFGYSFIENPWLCLPFEALESITASLAVTAAATYAAALSSLETIASVQGMMGALYFGIGRGTGSFVGGLLIRNFGHRKTFQFFGIGAFVACLTYMIVNILYVRKHSRASSGIDINNMNGLVLSNDSAKFKPQDTKEQFQMKPENQDTELGYGKVNPGFEDGTEDNAKFTDIPLDEDNNTTSNNPNNHKDQKR